MPVAVRLIGALAVGLACVESAGAGTGVGVAQAPIDSILVSEPYFSPNGDGVKDSTAVRFSISDTMHVHVHVRARAAADTVVVLLDSLVAQQAAPVTVAWGGRDGAGAIAAEGTYDLVVTGTDPDTQLRTVNQRQVQLDLTAPLVQIVELQPRPYTPSLPGAETQVRVRLAVSRSELADAVGVTLTAAADTLPVPLIDAFAGDGEYIAVCTDCANDADVPDGVHRVTASALDLAGNASAALDSLDKNVEGPRFEPLRHPALPVVQFADSLVGEVGDRQAIVALTLHMAGPAVDTLLALPPRDGIADASIAFFADVSTILAAPGAYALTFGAVDAGGVGDTLRTSLRVDRTPPSRPIPNPAPPPTTKQEILELQLQLDASTDRLYRAGGTLTTGIVDVTPPTSRQSIRLELGSNVFEFAALDSAGNLSDTTIVSVRWEPGLGLSAPERFTAGNQIQVDVGEAPASSVTIRLLALDGSLVREFEDATSQRVYQFEWDLRTRDGRHVRNGAYLVVAVVTRPNAEPDRFRQMIAVLE